MSFPIVLDFRITSKCNMNCPFCFGCKNIDSTLNLLDIEQIILKVKKRGIKKIVLGGGEPTIHNKILEILSLLKLHNIEIALSTNGTFFNTDVKDDILKHIDSIGIPIESSNENIHNNLRNNINSHLENQLELIKYININYPKVHIKLGTVISNYNYTSVVPIVKKFNLDIGTWKLYQISPHTNNTEFFNKYSISLFEFYKIVDDIKKHYPNRQFSIETLTESQRNLGHLFCEPNGDAMLVINNEEHKIGNFLINIDNIEKSAYDLLNYSKVNKNYESTYYRGNNEKY